MFRLSLRTLASLVSRRVVVDRHGSGRGAPHLQVGRRGERIAASMLRKEKYRVLGRNVRTSGGEADLVMLAPDRRTIVLVEVKSRVGGTIDPQRAINRDKQARLVRTLGALRRARSWEDRPGRIDVVTVWWTREGETPDIRHYVNAVGTNAVKSRSVGRRR